MSEISRSAPTVLFTLRLWHEALDEQRREWRGEVKNLSTGETLLHWWYRIGTNCRRYAGLHQTAVESMPGSALAGQGKRAPSVNCTRLV